MKIFQSSKVPSQPGSSLVLAYFVQSKAVDHPFFKKLKSSEKKLVTQYFRSKSFSAKANEVKVLPRIGNGKILLLGLGDRNKWNLRKLAIVSRRLVAAARVEKVKDFIIALADWEVSGLNLERWVQTLAENMVMANYEFSKYRTKKQDISLVKAVAVFVGSKSNKEISQGLARGVIVGEEVNTARDLGNVPGGEMTPRLLADKAREAGKQNKFKVTVLDEPALKKLKMGAILGVAKGSAEKPRLIIMEYYGGQKNAPPLVFVGKGVTFDTGGLNLKPEKGMNDMHLDMSGGAAVISALSAIAKLKLPINVVGLVPAVENMPGSAGYRPGDLLKSYSGKTIEVLNTDAEGRVILADALAYAARYKPAVVIDVATLTGACMVALGTHATGLMTPDSKLEQELRVVGEMSGDYVWPLPMWEEYEEEVKGTFGDVANLGKTPYGGAIAGAMFLKQFVGKFPWAHLDIAGPMKTFDGQYLAKGASGVGVRLLVELASSLLAKSA